MLRFNHHPIPNHHHPIPISIHPMLRFNFRYGDREGNLVQFQYILCYGSTLDVSTKYTDWFKISIHPMLRFNKKV